MAKTPPPTPPRRGEGRGERPRNIVIGQRVDEVKVQRARELRRQMTSEERILWQALRANRLHGLQFRRQQIIDRFIVDFYCHAAGLVVEVDGPIHEQQPGYDAERDQILSGRGMQILRIQNDEIRRNLPSVLARIAACVVSGSACDLTSWPSDAEIEARAKVADRIVKGTSHR